MLARAVLCVAALVPAALGQKLIWQRDGVVGQYRFSWRAAVIGDLNGDGWEDIAALVTLPGSAGGELWFLSGKDGTTLRIRPRYLPEWAYFVVARAGDMNGDGVPDYAFLAYHLYAVGGQVVEIASGLDDTRLWRIGPLPSPSSFGLTLLGELDLDGDGRPDLVVGDERDRANAIHAYDNAGRELYTVAIPPDLEALGGTSPEAFASLGDYDGDGAKDYVVGAATKYLASSGIAVVSGRTGQILLVSLTARFQFAEFVGDTVAATDDLDGDGVGEIYGGSFGIPGVLVLFSGRTGQELRWWPNPDPRSAAFVSSLHAGDLDRDGVRDALIGASGLTGLSGNNGDGRVLAYSGRDGGLLFEVLGTRFLGVAVDLLRGPPSDPFPLFMATMPDHGVETGSALGRVLLYRAKPPTVTLPGAPPCQGGLPAPAEIGLRDLAPSAGRGVRVHLSEAPSGVNAALFVGLSNTEWNGVPLPLDLSFLGLPPGCALHTSIDALALRVTGTSGLDAGYASVTLPFDLSMTGVRVYAQWLLFGPGNSWPGGLTRPLSWQLAL
jgi:hypothetical protein